MFDLRVVVRREADEEGDGEGKRGGVWVGGKRGWGLYRRRSRVL